MTTSRDDLTLGSATWSRWAPVALAFVVGGVASIDQVVLLREILVVLAGNEASIALSLSSWLAGVGLGAFAGSFLVKRERRLGGALLLAIGASVALVPFAVMRIRLAPAAWHTGAAGALGPSESALLCVTVVLPAALGVGLSFPPLVALAQRGLGRASAAYVYGVEAAGAFLGGGVFTCFLAGRVATFFLLLSAAVVLSAATMVTLVVVHRRGLAVPAGVMALVGTAALCSGYAMTLERETSRARFGSRGHRVAVIESRYQLLELSAASGQADLYADGTWLRSFPDPWERAAPIHVSMLQTLSPPERVLLVGGGVADRVFAALQHGPRAVIYVDTDPAVLRISRPFFTPADRRALHDRRVEIVAGDGRRVVERAGPASFDLIVVETADPLTTRANRYYTREFHAACRRALAPGGVLATRIKASVNYSQGDVARTAAMLHDSLRDVFGHVAIWPGGEMRMYASVAPGVATDSSRVLVERLRSRALTLEGFGAARLEDAFRPAEVAAAHRELERIESVPNTDGRPTALLSSLVLWDLRSSRRPPSRSGDGGAAPPSPFAALESLELWQVLAVIAVLMLFRGLSRRSRRRSYDGIWATFAGGVYGLGLEMILLLIVQNALGTLYWLLGVLVAVFMLGLTFGTFGARRLCERAPNEARRLALAVDAVAILAVLAAPLLAGHGLTTGVLCGIALFVAGFVTGGVYPPAVADLTGAPSAGATARSAGLADAADHVGACVGALTVGVVLLPVLGVLSSCVVLAGVRCLSLIGWAFPRRRSDRGARGGSPS